MGSHPGRPFVAIALAALLAGCGIVSYDAQTGNTGQNGSTGKTGGQTTTYRQLNAAIFTPHCSSCHDFNQYASAAQSAEEIYQMLASRRMPPRETLPSNYAAAVERWIQEGTPND